MWAGLECTINRIKNDFRDQLLYTGHYSREDDIRNIAKLNVRALRYPILWERHQAKKEVTIDWSWAKEQVASITDRKSVV